MAVKEIFLTKEYDDESWLGKFADENCYDVLLTEDADVYMPCTTLGMDPRDESLVLVKFRKGVFSKDIVDAAYKALLPGATSTNNRGIAAGPRGDDPRYKWVSRRQQAIMDFYAKGGSANSMTTLEETLKEVDRLNIIKPENELNHGQVWLVGKTKDDNFTFDAWEEKIKTMDAKEAAIEAKRVLGSYIQATMRAAEVNSGVGGFFDRYPRIPYCRATSFTANNFEQFKESYPFVEAVSQQFQKLMPMKYRNQKAACDDIDEGFVVGGSAFTTLTINNNFRTACHRDAGDLESGFGNIVALSNGVEYTGANLTFPKWRVAVDLRPGDYLAFSPHEVHGNTELGGPDGYSRMTLVLYFREKMLDCESKIIEDLRYEFVEYRRTNENHPLQRKAWNGVSPAMFSSQEWVDFLLMNGMNDYVKELLDGEDEFDLSDFF